MEKVTGDFFGSSVPVCMPLLKKFFFLSIAFLNPFSRSMSLNFRPTQKSASSNRTLYIMKQ